MPAIISSPEQAESATPTQPNQGLKITPELVKKIADQVYLALQRDLAIERERSRQIGSTRAGRTGRFP